ncbi:hypothetical protein NDU88_007996 [Pleurodeles waltl]|uniref:Uncharacterized protein n=1 Tax=Pleurodeles waltl TaxID=8319 RepID=A0AAV7N3N0_PLEWA|nr:hypothetical protein NDU88_007996 [Pleurodeles waltl]
MSSHKVPPQFISELRMPHLTPEEGEVLEADVTCKELREAPSQLHAAKALGTSGFLAEFWCLLWPQTGAILPETFCEAVARGELLLNP